MHTESTSLYRLSAFCTGCGRLGKGTCAYSGALAQLQSSTLSATAGLLNGLQALTVNATGEALAGLQSSTLAATSGLLIALQGLTINQTSMALSGLQTATIANITAQVLTPVMLRRGDVFWHQSHLAAFDMVLG